MKSFNVFIFVSGLLFIVVAFIFAKETDLQSLINLDENVQPKDLDLGEPKLLPDNPFYFFKNGINRIKILLTINSLKKAELQMKYANEKLMELKKIIENGKNSQITQRAIENYQKEIEKTKTTAFKIKQKVKDNPEVEKFLEKFLEQEILCQKLLQKLETKLSDENLQNIKKAREKHLEMLKEVALKLEDRNEKIAQELNNILEKQKGSEFQDFKNLEILKNFKKEVPDQLKEEIEQIEGHMLERLKTKLENMSLEDQEKFKEYLQQISGEKEIQLEILENLKEKIKQSPQKQKMIELKEKLEEEKIKMIENIENEAKKMNCQVQPIPNPDSCKEGKVIIEKDPKTGCLISLKCVQTERKNEQPQFCPTVWDPVCGKDGKTYSNECFAKLENVQVDYKGVCKNEKEIPVVCAQVITYCIDPDNGQCRTYSSSCSAPKPCKPCQIERPSPVECKNLWWFDNEHKFCQQKNFCGLYMYEGLKTFQTKEECESVLQNE